MLYNKIRNTDLKASRLILGSAEFGTDLPDECAFELLDTFAAAGGNILDTASVYADWLNRGKSMSEKTIGKWLESRKKRSKMIVLTKGGHYDLKTGKKRIDVQSIREDFENSLENLRTDYIDIYWLHKDDEDKSPEQIIDLFNEAADDRAKYFGVSNWPYERVRAANEYAVKNGLKPFIANQIRYSLAKVNYDTDGIFVMNDSEYKKYAADNLNVFGFSSQARGFFAIMDKSGEQGLSDFVRKELYNDYNLGVLKRLREMAERKNVSVPALVVAALVSDKKVATFAQIGPRRVEELNASLESADLELTQQERDELLNG